MTTEERDDVVRLLAYIDSVGLVPVPAPRRWNHMGAVLCDAGLQAGVNHRRVVLPRVRRLVAEWPGATTTSAFRAQVAEGDLGGVLDWRGHKKLGTIRALAEVLGDSGIETTADLADAYAAEDNTADTTELVTRLRDIVGVGQKTVDYLPILVGSDRHLAVDERLRSFARTAGVTGLAYARLRGTYTEAAARRGWSPGNLDRAVWNHRTTP